MARGDNKGKMGRPTKPIDPSILLRFLQIYPTKAQTANFFDCSEAHIEDEVDRLFECTFTALRERESHGIKRALMSWCLRYAKAGNHNLIQFAMKNVNGWTDKPELSSESSQVIELKYSINKKNHDETKENEPKQIAGASGDVDGKTKETT